MSDPIDDLDEQLRALEARESAAILSPEDEARAAKFAALAERKAALAVAEKKRRGLDMFTREAAARKRAGGRYLVGAIDLGELYPSEDPATLPGGGVLIYGGPELPNIYANFLTEHEANARPLLALMVDVVCAATLDPECPLATEEGRAAGVKLRNFFEGPIGSGAAITVGNAVTRLGGMMAKQAKRGRVS